MTDILQSLEALINDLHTEEDDQIVDRVDQIQSIKDFDLEDLTDAQREQLIQKLSDLSSRTMNMMSKLLEKNSGQELYLKDLEVNKNLQDVKQYTEFGLWRSLYKQNLLLHERIHRTMKRLSHTAKQQETHSTTRNEGEAQQSFRDLYMSEITASFEDELDRLRQDDGFDGHKMQLLIDCLEGGTKLYSPEEQEFIMNCFTKK